MSPRSRRLAAVLLLLLLGLGALLLIRCNARSTPEPQSPPAVTSTPPPPASTPTPPATEPTTPAAPTTTAEPVAENLSPATVQAPESVSAGAAFSVTWTGPDNRGDYVTIVRPDARDADYGNYAETRHGRTLELTAPMEPGDYEVRYVALRSKTILGRASLKILPVTASLQAPTEAPLGTEIEVTWTGPNNTGDYITVVAKGTPDGRYGNYTETKRGSPLTLRLPTDAGESELRYMTGQGAQVLARRELKILTPETSLSAPDEVVAGAVFTTEWVGPNNPGDYVTIVPRGTPDGQYKNYAETRKGASLEITALIEPGEAELRYMTGQRARVLTRRPIRVVAATIALEAPAEAVAGAAVPITWTGPNNAGDYLTIVPRGTRDGQYARYAETRKGSPVEILAPAEEGPAEIRYMSGQGSRVLARRELLVKKG